MTSYHFCIGLKICIQSRRRRAPAEDVFAEGSRDGPVVKFCCHIPERFSHFRPHGENGAESTQRKRPPHSGQGPNDSSRVCPWVPRLDCLVPLPRSPPGWAPRPQGTMTCGQWAGPGQGGAGPATGKHRRCAPAGALSLSLGWQGAAPLTVTRAASHAPAAGQPRARARLGGGAASSGGVGRHPPSRRPGNSHARGWAVALTPGTGKRRLARHRGTLQVRSSSRSRSRDEGKCCGLCGVLKRHVPGLAPGA